jgi:antitoxin component YwqK of YwqJK toxin-antitoxin module
MKNKNYIIPLAVLFLAVIYQPVFSQEKTTDKKIKSKITHEEKVIKGVKSSLIDSEEKFDFNGNLIEEIDYKDGKVDKHLVYEYDSNNNKIKESELDSDGKVKKYSEFKYENGLRTEKNTYDQDKKVLSKKTYTYTF